MQELKENGDAMTELYSLILEDKADSAKPFEQQPRDVVSVIPSGLSTTAGRGGLLIAIALLFALALAMFHSALDFVPGTADDLELLNSVVHTTQPLKYFVGDFGMAPYETGNYGQYRPLHPASLWIVYKVFGLRAFPNQLINFLLHFLNATLVLIVIWRVQKDPILGFMGASLFLVSVHTMSPAIWVSDRPNLQVGLALLLLFHHVVRVRETGGRLRTPYVFLLCLFALLSKESGLIVPVMAVVVSMRAAGRTLWQRLRSSTIWAALIVAYLVGRITMFGTNAFSYSTLGYLFGVWPYSLGSALPGHLRQLSMVDNVVKNMVEVFLPIFNEGGGFTFKFDTARVAFGVGLGALAMVFLLAQILRKKLLPLQIDCLWAILFNAVIHNAIFRYRDLYVAQIAMCIFIACSPLLEQPRRRAIALAAACLLLVVSVIRVDDYVQGNYLLRYNELNGHHLERVLKTFHGRRVDPELARQLVAKYRDRSY
jgi:hypothetical protein